MQISSTTRAIPLAATVTRGFQSTLRANARLTGCQRRIIVDKEQISKAEHLGAGFYATQIAINGDPVRIAWRVRHGKLEQGAAIVSNQAWAKAMKAFEERQEAIKKRTAELRRAEAERKAQEPVDLTDVVEETTGPVIFTNSEMAVSHFGVEKLSDKNGRLLAGAALKGRLSTLGAKFIFTKGA